MNTTRHLPVPVRHLIISVALVPAVLLAPAWAMLATSAPAGATSTSTGTAEPDRHHGGPNYWAITGARVGAPNEGEVSSYGGSHKHLWVEQELYGPGVVVVPHVDTTVHQSR
jgi:hypothetical protein